MELFDLKSRCLFLSQTFENISNQLFRSRLLKVNRCSVLKLLLKTSFFFTGRYDRNLGHEDENDEHVESRERPGKVKKSLDNQHGRSPQPLAQDRCCQHKQRNQ